MSITRRERRADRRRQARSRVVALAACAGLIMLLAGGLLWTAGGPGAGGIGGTFHLVDTRERPVTDRDFRGRWTLIYFGYTRCPDVCPTTLHGMAEALRGLGPDADRVRAVFITVDPARDTPAALRDYLDAIDPGLVGLTGTPEQVAAAERAFRITSEVHHAGAAPDSYVVDHSAVLFLIGPDGRFVAPIPIDAPSAAIAWEIRQRLG